MQLLNDDVMNVLDNMSNESVDLIITDPPYKTTSRGRSKNTTTGGMLKSKLMEKGKIFSHNDIDITVWLPELYRVLVSAGHCYIMTNQKNITNYLNVIDDSEFHFIKNLIWVKDNKIMGQCYMSQFEYIIMLRKGSHKRINNCGVSDVLSFNNKKTQGNSGALHPTEKPVKLIEVLVGNSSSPGDVVFDPFMGIGSTGIASKNLGRDFIGVDIDETYFRIAKDRIDSAQGDEFNFMVRW